MPEAQAETWAGYEGTQPLAPYQGAWSDLVRAGGWHVLLAGPSGSGKTRMLVAAALSDASTRVVAVPRSEVKNLAALGVALAEHPRACFVVVLENLAVTPGEVQWVENCFPGFKSRQVFFLLFPFFFLRRFVMVLENLSATPGEVQWVENVSVPRFLGGFSHFLL